MIKEEYTTEGPQKITIRFKSEIDDLVQVDVVGAIRTIGNHARFVLDVQEFKSLLKAGLRFDEQISS